MKYIYLLGLMAFSLSVNAQTNQDKGYLDDLKKPVKSKKPLLRDTIIFRNDIGYKGKYDPVSKIIYTDDRIGTSNKFSVHKDQYSPSTIFTLTPIKTSIFSIRDKDNSEIMRFEGNGDIYYKDRKLTSDTAIVNSLRRMLNISIK